MLAALLWTSLALLPAFRSEAPRARVALDQKRREVVVSAGPFEIHSMAGMQHADMEKMNDHNTPVYYFDWPVEGWLRGFAVEVVDGANHPIPRRLVHHLIVINFDRRQLLYPSYERTFGIGQETQDLSLPKSIGVPLHPGTRMGFYLAWDNATGRDLDGVELRIRLRYSPGNLSPRPVAVLPLYMDVNLTVGRGNGFQIPPGRSEKSWEFVPPVGGHLLGVGGHLHDYGVGVRLEEAETGKVLTQLSSTRTPEGKLKRMERKLFGVTGRGLRLRAGRRYRVVGVYDNPTGQPISGSMASMVALFAPESSHGWPTLDLGDPTLRKDLAFLTGKGGGSAGHTPQ